MAQTLKGFAFPFQIDATTGSVRAQTEDDKLRANVVHILLTNVRERVMRRSYGGGLRAIVQDPDNSALVAVVQHQVGKSIGMLEPRVMLQDLKVSQADDGATLLVTVTYLVRRTKAVETLSVPIAMSGL